MLQVFAEQAGVQAQDTARQTVFGIGDFKFDGLFDKPLQLRLKARRPNLGVLCLDAIDKINAEVQVNRLVTQDVLELFADAGHAVLPVKRKHHHEAAVKEDSFHDDVEANKVFDKSLHPSNRVSAEDGLKNVACQLHLEGVLVANRINLVIHIEEFYIVESQR